MSTTRQFQDMINEYLPNKLLREELTKRDYILTKCSKDEGWLGGDVIVPFRGSRAPSVQFGGLTPAADIAQAKRVRGKIEDYREVWYSLKFDHTDIMQHGELSEQNLLKILPDEIEDGMIYYKDVVSTQLGSGPHFAKVTDSTNAASGIMIVDRIERFQIDQKMVLDDDDTGAVVVWVTNVANDAIDVNTNAVKFSLTKGGAAANLSAYTAAQNAKFYHPGVFDAGGSHYTFFSMRQALLSAANGGSANIHGQSKLAYPFLQAVNIDGGASGLNISATNLLTALFDAWTIVRRKCKGMATDYLMSLKHLGTAMKILETQKGAFAVYEQPKASQFGWTEITIASVTTGVMLKLVGIQEMDDDIIPIVDWSTITLRSNGGFRKRKSPKGEEYFEIRSDSAGAMAGDAGGGYAYIVDICLFGEMEYSKPGHNAIIFGIPNY